MARPKRFEAQRGVSGGAAAALAALCALAVSLSVATPAAGDAVPRSFWGVVNHGAATAEDFVHLEEGRVGSLRVLVPWHHIQSRPDGGYDWEELDSVVAGAAAAGADLLLFPYGSPSWVTRNPAVPPLRSSADRDAWAVFLIELVARYGRGGSFWDSAAGDPPLIRWQIWNEPNFRAYWKPGPDAEDYARLVRMSARTIRSVDARAEVVLAGFAPVHDGQLPWKFMRDLYRVKGIERFFEVAALSTYAPTLEGIEFQIEKALAAMRRAGDRTTPILITEIGWGSAGKGPLVKGLRGQARLLRRSFETLVEHRRRWRIAGLHWFSLQDAPTDPRFCSFCSHAGLFTEERQAKPAWREFTRFTGGR